MHKKKHNDKVMAIVLPDPGELQFLYKGGLSFGFERNPKFPLYLVREKPLSQLGFLMPHLANRKFIIVYDEMVVEKEATPLGLGMEDRDVIFLKSAPAEENYPILLSGVSEWLELTKKKSGRISMGLNVLLGENEEFPVHNRVPVHDPKCQEQLRNLQTALLPALDLTIAGYELDRPSHLPDISRIQTKLETNKYNHANEGLQEVESVLNRYKKSVSILASSDREEATRRRSMYERLAATMAEYYAALTVPDCDAVQHDEEVKALNPEDGFTFYMGPVRNSTPMNYMSSQPILMLSGVGRETTVDDLVEAWVYYTHKFVPNLAGLTYPFSSVSHANRDISLGENIKVFDIIQLDALKKFYFCLPPMPHTTPKPQSDERDIDDLLQFIEGDNRKDREKTKKKKKKKISTEINNPSDDPAIVPCVKTKNNSSNSQETDNMTDKVIVPNSVAQEGSSVKAEVSKSNNEKEDVTDLGATSNILDKQNNLESQYNVDVVGKINTLIEEKTLLIQKHRNFTEGLIDNKAKEMTILVIDIEKAQDKKAAKIKEIVDIDDKIQELQANKDTLKKVCEEQDELINNLVGKKRKLENHIAVQISECKVEIAKLEEDVRKLRVEISKPCSNIQLHPESANISKHPNIELLKYISNKIEAKKNELECPVCLETAQPPIFMCDDLHLICSECRPKVLECPECRAPYPAKARRHRYAERAAQELTELCQERQGIMDMS